MSKKLYGVLLVKEKLNIEVLGLKQELNLKWSQGQFGALPIFNNFEDAAEYADNNIDLVFDVIVKDKN